MNIDYDLIIIGAGLAGSTLAASLDNTPYRIALIDQCSPSTLSPANQFELRINAYNLASEKLLRDIGIWQLLPSDRIFAFNKVHVCNEAGHGSISFTSKDINHTYLGHFIENNLVNYYLAQHIANSENIDTIHNTSITAINQHKEHIVVESDQRQWSAKLVIACDGANSVIRTLAKIRVKSTLYRQKCIVGTIGFNGDHQSTAWQNFLTTGPIGLLPLAPGYCSLAWSCEQHKADQLMAMNDADFIEQLDKVIAGHLGLITHISKRAAFSLMARHAETYIAQRIALVGDAAHVIHPLAGLGANLGFQDVSALRNLILQPSHQNDIGSTNLLKQYEHERRWHNHLILSSMTMLNTLFSNHIPLLSRLRNIGMAAANKLTPAKKLLLKQAAWMKFC